MGNLAKLDAALRQIPAFTCKPGCSECCGPVAMSRLEWQRICDRLGYKPNRNMEASLDCPMLKDGRCSVYDIRPTICRLFGTVNVPLMLCPHGCRPERLLPDAEAGMLLNKAQRLGA
jgi:Fe-S-cluster containining protein